MLEFFCCMVFQLSFVFLAAGLPSSVGIFKGVTQ